MEKKEAFKTFASKHPELVQHIKNGSMSWQQFYEIYDIYGEEDSAWKDYLKKSDSTTTEEPKKDAVSAITEKLSNINMDSIQEHIKTAQKALNLVSELTTKGGAGVAAAKGPVSPRPINKFFED